MAAWKAFVAADAWGAFDGSDYAKAFYAAGWPKDVRRLRRGTASRWRWASAGSILATCKTGLDTAIITTTRKHYAPVLVSRLKQASETLAGRFPGWKNDSTGETIASVEPIDGIH